MARNMPHLLKSAALRRATLEPKHTNTSYTMKLIKVTALGLIALCLGACASKPSSAGSVPPPGPTTVISSK